VASFAAVAIDQPWIRCTVHVLNAELFNPVRELLGSAERALSSGEHDRAVQLLAELALLELRLTADDGGVYEKFLIWFEGEEFARIRFP